MNFELLLSDETRLDIFEAFLWYEEQLEGLGFDFELCLEAGLNLWPLVFCLTGSGRHYWFSYFYEARTNGFSAGLSVVDDCDLGNRWTNHLVWSIDQR